MTGTGNESNGTNVDTKNPGGRGNGLNKVLKIVLILSVSFNIAFVFQFFYSQDTGAIAEHSPVVLSEKQLDRIAPIQKVLHRKNDTIKKEIARCQKQLLKSLQSDEPDRKAIMACIEEINSLQKKVQINTIDEILAVKKHMEPHQCHCMLENMKNAIEVSSEPCSCGCSDHQ